MPKLHVAGFCEPGPSHIKNLAALGRELQRRGHRFTIFHLQALEREVLREGVDFAALDPAGGQQHQLRYPAAKMQRGVSAQNFLTFAKETATLICDAAPEALRTAGVDCVLADMAQPAVATVAEALRLPYVTVCHAVPLHRDPRVPPDFLPWRYRTEWWARWRNSLAYQVRDFMIRPLNQLLNQYRRKWGLRTYRKPEDSFSPYAQITQLIPEFDFPRCLPDCFHYVGPYRRSEASRVSFPFEYLDGRPVVYATMGTSAGHRSDLWLQIASACATLDVQLVISLGGATRTDEVEHLPGGPLVVDYAPQIELLARTTVLITHAGLNTAIEALAAGVPMIAMPVTGDQFGVAARIAYCGVGQIIDLANCRAAAVASALRELLNNPAYRSRAAELRRSIQTTRGAEAAADIIEDVMTTATTTQLASTPHP
jgi:zeaxanthin glucosyltransferase